MPSASPEIQTAFFEAFKLEPVVVADTGGESLTRLLDRGDLFRGLVQLLQNADPEKVIHGYTALIRLCEDVARLPSSHFALEKQQRLEELRQWYADRFMQAFALAQEFDMSTRFSPQIAVVIAACINQAAETFKVQPDALAARVNYLRRQRLSFHDSFGFPDTAAVIADLLAQLKTAPDANVDLVRHIEGVYEETRVNELAGIEHYLTTPPEEVASVATAANLREIAASLGMDPKILAELVDKYMGNLEPLLRGKIGYSNVIFFTSAIIRLFGLDARPTALTKLQGLGVTQEMFMAGVIQAFGRNLVHNYIPPDGFISQAIAVGLLAPENAQKLAGIITDQVSAQTEPPDTGPTYRFGDEVVELRIYVTEFSTLKTALQILRDLKIAMDPYGDALIRLFIRHSEEPSPDKYLHWLDIIRQIADRYGVDPKELDQLTHDFYFRPPA